MMSASVESTPKIPHYQHHYVKTEEWINTGTQEVMVFYPTLDEISDFPALIKKIEKKGAHLASGICKIVPPEGWSPRPSRAPGDYSDVEDVRIYAPVKETIEGMSGCFTRSISVYRKKMTAGEFRDIALSKDMCNPKPEFNLAQLERYYWRSILFGEPIYGADSPGSLFEEDVKELNMGNLGTILDLLDAQNIKISGVNTPFLYFGMWKTTFPWHVEDMDLYSINYLHYGEPKFWYAIPSQSAERFERLACQQFPDGSNICKAFLRHKLYIISPTVLKSHSIPYGTMVQYPNEIIITFPKGYHMGFNVGYNCAEAINFALDRWVDFGKNAVLCPCRQDGVEIDMRPFMLKYRPDEYEDWYNYWYMDRDTALQDEKSRKKAAVETDPVLNTIYTERHRRLAQAKRSVKKLWSTQPVNLYNEKDYNVRRSKMFPHCAVCQYFIPRRVLVSQKIRSALPRRSRRYVTDQLFYKDTPLPEERHQLTDDDLYQCINCQIVVHKHCYSEFDGFNSFKNATTDDSPLKFVCVRCYGREDTEIRAAACALCELRGGALVEMQNVGATDTQKLFVHMICALLHAGTRFLKPEQRRSVHRPPPKWLLPEDEKDNDNFSSSQASSEPFRSPEYIYAAPPARDTASTSSLLTTSCNSEKCEKTSFLSTSNDLNDISTSTEPSKFWTLPASSNINNTNEFADSSASCSADYSGMVASSSYSPPPAKRNVSLSASSRYECEVCNGLSQDLIQCDICVSVEENSAAAALRYHITCAPLADMTFERRDHTPYAVAICPFHNSSHVIMKPDTREITAGERVIVAVDSEKVEYEESDTASNNDSRVRCLMVGKGRVTKTSECLYCTVDFLDGSVSRDLYPCDIRRCECQRFGCKNDNHLAGSLVHVQWHDSLLYEGYYRGKAPTRKYFVQLEAPLVRNHGASLPCNSSDTSMNNAESGDFRPPISSKKTQKNDLVGEVLELTQEEVFTLDEALPEDVRLALLKRRSNTTIELDGDQPSPKFGVTDKALPFI